MSEPDGGLPQKATGLAAGSSLSRWVSRCLTIRDKPGFVERICFGLAGLAAVLGVWFVLTAGEPEDRIIGSYTLPSISETAASFKSLWFERALARSTLASLGRVLGGFFLAASVAVPMGVLAASYLRLNAFLRPVSVFGRNIPIAALIPLTLIWFGLGETQKVMFIFLATVAFIFFDTAYAVRGVSDRFLDTAYTLGARTEPKAGLRRAGLIAVVYGVVLGVAWYLLATGSGSWSAGGMFSHRGFWVAGVLGTTVGFLIWYPIQSHQVLHKVLMPLAMPDIVNSLRLLFGLAFGYIMLAEVINAKLGLGNIIIMSQRRGPREHIYLSLIIIALLAFCIDRLVLWAQKRWFPYIQHDEG